MPHIYQRMTIDIPILSTTNFYHKCSLKVFLNDVVIKTFIEALCRKRMKQSKLQNPQANDALLEFE